jgi:hypothetical protein
MVRKITLAIAMIGIMALAPAIASACASCGKAGAHHGPAFAPTAQYNMAPAAQPNWAPSPQWGPSPQRHYTSNVQYGSRPGLYAGQNVSCGVCAPARRACPAPCAPACPPAPCRPRCGLFGSLGFGW